MTPHLMSAMEKKKLCKKQLIYWFLFSTAVWTKQCHACTEGDAATCRANQKSQSCATDPESLGITECASTATKYRDMAGNVQEGFIRGCLDCQGEAYMTWNQITECQRLLRQLMIWRKLYFAYQFFALILNRTFSVRFGSISGEFGLATVRI